MLPAAARMRRHGEFTATVRGGTRAAAPRLVLHWRAAAEHGLPTRVGFVVSRGVGTAVTRNLVRRRLRHLVRDRLAALPEGSSLVVRATSAAADANAATLASDLDRGLRRLGLTSDIATGPAR